MDDLEDAASNRQTTTRRGWDPLTLIAAALLALALVYTAWAASSLLIPATISLFTFLVLSVPLARLKRSGIPPILGVFLLAGTLFAMMSVFFATVLTSAEDWANRLPVSFYRIETRLEGVLDSLEAIQEASESVEAVTSGKGEEDVQTVVLDNNFVRDRLFSDTYQLLSGTTVIIIMTGFLLMDNGRIGRRLAGLLPNFASARRAIIISRAVQDRLAHYLLTITLVNSGLAVAVALALYALNIPEPWLWGALAGLLNFIPFVGPLATITLLTFVTLGLPEPSARYFLAPLAVLGINIVEANFVTPSLLALRLRLSSVAIIISVIFWGWLWGIAGVVLAVPILATIKIVSLNVPTLVPLARVIGGTDELREGTR